MKKLLALLLVAFLIPTVAFAQDEISADTTQYQEPFVIFVHEDCPHCQEVEDWVDANDLGDKVTLLELKDNTENQALIEQYWTDLEIDGSMAWPMMVVDVDTKEYELGSTPIIVKLADVYGIDYNVDAVSSGVVDTPESDDKSGDTIFFVLGGLLVVSVVGYVIYSLLSEEE